MIANKGECKISCRMFSADHTFYRLVDNKKLSIIDEDMIPVTAVTIKLPIWPAYATLFWSFVCKGIYTLKVH